VANDVSESQREFIDLAFRMALMEVSAHHGDAMLVLETPEANLDTVFITRAGQFFGRFARDGEGGNRLLASCNLNQTRMIPALFGVFSEDEKQVIEDPNVQPIAPDDRDARVLDLLAFAKPNAAVRDFGDAYQRELDRAVHPERYTVAPREG
jgi:hypothetical protein